MSPTRQCCSEGILVARFSQRTRSKVVTNAAADAAALRLFASSFSHFSQLAEVVAGIVFTIRKTILVSALRQ